MVISRAAPEYFIDLEIYRAGGALISHGINPYDHSAGTEIREDIFRFHRDALGWGWPPSVESWNFYASSNLPLTLLLFGAIHTIHPTPGSYRAVFMVADALVAVLAFLLIRWRWGCTSRKLAMALALLLGLNAAFLKWGTYCPEDKGVQTLFMFAVIALMVPDQREWWRLIATGVALAAAISFKLLGVFLLPAALLWAHRQRRLLIMSAIVGALCLAINLPYLRWMSSLFTRRMDMNTAAAPTHSSIWVYPCLWWPGLQALKPHLLVTLAAAAVAAIQLYRRKISLEVFGGVLAFLFSVVFLIAGSIDRATMGIMALIGTLGAQRPAWGLSVLAIWTIGGTAIGVARSEATEGLILLAVTMAIAVVQGSTAGIQISKKSFS